MDTITLRAHFDGEHILLDELFELEPDAKIIVTVFPKDIDAEREAWSRLSQQRLETAYADDESEYSLGMIKEANPEYARR